MHAKPTTHPISVQSSCVRATGQKIRRITSRPSESPASTWLFSHSPTYQRLKSERLRALRVCTMPHARRAWVYASSASGVVSMIFSVRSLFLGFDWARLIFCACSQGTTWFLGRDLSSRSTRTSSWVSTTACGPIRSVRVRSSPVYPRNYSSRPKTTRKTRFTSRFQSGCSSLPHPRCGALTVSLAVFCFLYFVATLRCLPPVSPPMTSRGYGPMSPRPPPSQPRASVRACKSAIA